MFMIESSVNKSVATADSPQALLCKFVEGFFWTDASEKLCHFHPLHRDLDISWAIIAESSTLHIADSRTRTANH